MIRLTYFITVFVLLTGCSQHYNPRQYVRELDCKALAKKRIAAKPIRTFKGKKKNIASWTALSKKVADQRRDITTNHSASEPLIPLLATPVISTHIPEVYKPERPYGPSARSASPATSPAATPVSKRNGNPEIKSTSIAINTKSLTDQFLTAGLIAGPALLSLLTLGLFSGSAMKLSAWAAHHPIASKILLAGIQTGTIVGGYALGDSLSYAGLNLPGYYPGIAFAGFCGAALLYPAKSKSLNNLRVGYLQQKVCDVTIYLASATMVMYAGNHQFAVNNSRLIPYYSAESYQAETVSMTAYIPSLSSAVPADKQEEPAKKNGKIWMIILASVVFSILAVTVAVAACLIACNGQGFLALSLLIGGEVGFTFAFVGILKTIGKRYRVKRKRKLKSKAHS
jgi:hypothetical protein